MADLRIKSPALSGDVLDAPGVGYWRAVPEASHEAWLELDDPEGFYRASARFDGCIHFHRYYNMPYDRTRADNAQDEAQLEDYIHICDVDDMIERLQALKVAALAHFGAGWPE